jgi:hypothetical protein
MDLRLATLKAVSFYLLHNASTLSQCRKYSCVTDVCKRFASYQDYPNYRWDLGQPVHEDGKVVSLKHRPPLPPGNIPVTYFC